MKQLWSLLSALALVAAVGTTAGAHHSAVQYDFTKTVTVSGVVVKFQAINPHMRLTLRVAGPKGTREIEIEGHSTNNMYRAGYRDGLVKAGDTITVHVAPLRDGREGGYMVAGVAANGTRFGAQTAAERQREREKAESK